MSAYDPFNSSLFRWILLSAFLLGIPIVPFLIAAEPLDLWTQMLLRPDGAFPWLALAVVGLLSLDIVLPIPSSIVSTAAGLLLGAVWGTVFSFLGMTIGCIAGYAIGRLGSTHIIELFIDERQHQQLRILFGRHGLLILAATRGVPVLAEASIVAAGLARYPPFATLLVSASSNFAISLVYCSIGATASSQTAFVLAFAASLLIPGLLMMVWRRIQPLLLRQGATARGGSVDKK